MHQSPIQFRVFNLIIFQFQKSITFWHTPSRKSMKIMQNKHGKHRIDTSRFPISGRFLGLVDSGGSRNCNSLWVQSLYLGPSLNGREGRVPCHWMQSVRILSTTHLEGAGRCYVYSIFIYFTLGRQNECIILLENALWWDTHGITECVSSQSLGESSWELWELGIDMTKAVWLLMVLKGPIIRHQTSMVLVFQLFCPFVCGVTCTLSWKLGKPWVTQSTVYRLWPFMSWKSRTVLSTGNAKWRKCSSPNWQQQTSTIFCK